MCKINKGNVFNIQKLSIHDGPGIRTLVFLKGCPLRCLWCANPESLELKPQIASFYNRCIGCGACKEICPKDAITVVDGAYVIDTELCDDNCQLCSEECYAESKRIVGKEMTADEVIDEIMKDRGFYKRSGGGVTFSGGEPLMQADFLLEILKECKRLKLHTAIETSGYADNNKIKEIAEYLDLIYFDIKHLDSNKHRELTGVLNHKILGNLKTLNDMRKSIIVRIPIIPTYNDDENHIKGIAEFCMDLKSVIRIELLPYHNLGESKYKSIDKEYGLSEIETPASEQMDKLWEIISDIGIDCEVVEIG